MTHSGFPRGSEWRKWDLHVHSPYSCLNNGFGNDFEVYVKALLEQAVEKNVAAIGVTDYFSIQGYRRLRALMDDSDKLESLVGDKTAASARRILLLPNIELRASTLVNDNRVNFHVIFSNELDPDTIEEHFFRELKFTSEANPGGSDSRLLLTIPNLEVLGRRLKAEQESFRSLEDLQVGMMNATVEHGEVTDKLEGHFKDKYLVVVAADEDLSKLKWNGQGHLTRKLLIQKAHMLFSANPATREWGLGNKQPPGALDFVTEFKSRKPCIHGSDAHAYEKLFEPDNSRYTWIKTDLTFQGLRQVLTEPESRVFIGDVPTSVTRARRSPTKYMTSVSFARSNEAGQGEKWFSGEVLLNNGLIAIIGNKGSGKSALADVLALLGDTHASGYFSFLNGERFLAPKTQLGSKFRAKVLWKSGKEIERPLGYSVDRAAPEVIKYIPQSYLETICSELKDSSATEFSRELMDVILSHVQESDRLGKATLQELIDYRTSETEESVKQLIDKLESIDSQIVSLEEQASEDYRRHLVALLAQRRAELDALDASKPNAVPKPEQDAAVQAQQSAFTTRLAEMEQEIADLQRQANEAREKDRNETTRIAIAEKLLVRIANLERQYEAFIQASREDENALHIDLNACVNLTVDKQPIMDVKRRAEEEQGRARSILDPQKEGSVATKLVEITKDADEQRAQLDRPNQVYQQYLQALKDWEERRGAIEGNPEAPNSVKGLEARLAELEQLPTKIEELAATRTAITREIYGVKELLLSRYRDLYAPVQAFIDQHPISRKHGALQFRASITVHGLEEDLLKMIHQGRIGSFYGEVEGRKLLQDMVKSADLSTPNGVLQFISQLLDHLRYDRRDEPAKAVTLGSQLRQRYSPKDVYDFLFGLDYLKPQFELRWQDKPLDQLSPGERGSLLLIFYLLIDTRDVPLIIDQPEDNLDNQTIAEMLVPAMKEAKERRQIIMVTHNPNLAVVCDADQIIYASLDKTDGNQIVYTSGALENPRITQLIVDVLEGTKPAFDLRDAKYSVLEQVHK